jgi:hypothetical protein
VEREQDLQFEWVNAWAEAVKPAAAPATPKADPVLVPAVAAQPPVVQPAATLAVPVSADQLTRDIAEIERVRDVLAARPGPVFAKHRMQALTLVPARTTDAVPVVIGGVLVLVMLTVFGAAAAMTKLAR